MAKTFIGSLYPGKSPNTDKQTAPAYYGKKADGEPITSYGVKPVKKSKRPKSRDERQRQYLGGE